ncbi:MAG: hypothetical protein Q9190_007733 [Brigantiaea leucoxantha]
MTATPPAPLLWSSQFNVIETNRTPPLKGDKIILPQSALEQLLNAVTINVPTATRPITSAFNSFNPYSFAAEQQARSQTVERQQQLPHPLTFRLVNPTNGKVVYTGIREFSADEGEVGVSAFIRQSLGIDDYGSESSDIDHSSQQIGISPQPEDVQPRLTVHAEQLPKGTYVRLRPLEAGYDPDDWKALLERHLRDTFTTLTSGEILTVPAGKEVFRFLVDDLKPNSQAISLVDTDLEVDIEALNEEQARETLKQRLEKSQRPSDSAQGSSPGGVLQIDQQVSGQVRHGEYVDYSVERWDSSKDIDVELESIDTAADADIFVIPAGPKQRAKPREDEHVFGELSSMQHKRIKIRHTNAELDNAEALWISVRGYRMPEHTSTALDRSPIPFRLQVSPSNTVGEEVGIEANGLLPNSEDEQCKNCHQWVPRRTMMLHENFCYRNNILCPQCSTVFQKSSSEWKNHWHCPHDSEHGNTSTSRTKHDDLFHSPRNCPLCLYLATNVPDLAHHRTTTCPGKTILCQFCHLLVPQQGPEDPEMTDPEVVLSGLTPHELTDGARTTECHLCSKIVRLRDMSAHLKHHDLQRLSRPKPRICRNVNCGRTIDGVGRKGELIGRQLPARNELAICDNCFGPLYTNTYDPDGKALGRRVERRYLTQMLTGCGKEWCGNEVCKTGRKNLGMEEVKGSKDAMGMIRPLVEGWKAGGARVSFCTDEASQRRRNLAEMVAAEMDSQEREQGKGQGKAEQVANGGYDLEWAVAALEVEAGDLLKSRGWLKDWAPTRAESAR